MLENAFTGTTPGIAIVRLYYVNPDDWDGYRSSAYGVAYYEFQVYEDLTISLLNEEHEPLATWNVVHAWPVKWNMTDFNAEESKIAIETIELTYHYFNMK